MADAITWTTIEWLYGILVGAGLCAVALVRRRPDPPSPPDMDVLYWCLLELVPPPDTDDADGAFDDLAPEHAGGERA